MNRMLDNFVHPTSHNAEQVADEHESHQQVRCAICERRLGGTLHYLEETGDVQDERRSWTLCGDCNSAVRQQMESTTVRGPLRLRVAVGLVATERTPAARRANWGQLSDRHWERVLFWSFFLFMLAHLAFLVVLAVTTIGH
ncbi:MAG: hypothetical protein ABI068_14860 [Ktedonobacterales bacterium]